MIVEIERRRKNSDDLVIGFEEEENEKESRMIPRAWVCLSSEYWCDLQM